jgi:hypothetical protein
MIKSDNFNFYQDSLDYILKVQMADGSISWEKDKKLDPWDHIEAAMGLVIGGKEAEARSAFIWLKENQEEDGSWFAEYLKGIPSSERKESNFTAYVATGLWHNYLITKNKSLLEEMFSTLDLAMKFVISLQTSYGDIQWAKENNQILDDSLITGCSSIYKSLDCAIPIYSILGKKTEDLVQAKKLLKTCLLENAERFDRSWESKKRYSMDWYYPVMCGVVKGNEAEDRIRSRWDEFIVSGMGCKCVQEEPWVTVAESSELVVALMVIEETDKAKELFDWLHQWRDPKDNLYWTGYVYTDRKYWPIEKPTWTAGAVLLAADSLFAFTNGSKLFLEDWGDIDHEKIKES